MIEGPSDQAKEGGRSRSSTGLGLAIIKHVLLRHPSELEIDGERGKGSTFARRLPARRIDRTEFASDAPNVY